MKMKEKKYIVIKIWYLFGVFDFWYDAGILEKKLKKIVWINIFFLFTINNE